MPELLMDSLATAKKLVFEAKFEDALKIINKVEKADHKSKEQLSAIILKARIYIYSGKYGEAKELGKKLYNIAKNQNNISDIISALLIRSRIILFGKIEKADEIIHEIDKLREENLKPFQKADYLFMKSVISFLKDDYLPALELAKQSLNLFKKIGYNLDIAIVHRQLANIYMLNNEKELALEHAFMSFEMEQLIKNEWGVGESLSLIAGIYYSKREFDRALKHCKQLLKMKKINDHTKLETLGTIGAIYREKGEIVRALRYYNKAVILSEELKYYNELVINLLGMGSAYRMKGNSIKAQTIFENTLRISEFYNNPIGIKASLFYLVLVNLENNNYLLSNKYLSRLESLIENADGVLFSDVYSIGKALTMKKKGRLRDRTEAERLLKQVSEKGILPQLFLLSQINLCELFLEELSMTNNTEVLDELEPLISKMYEYAENQNSYSWLAETKLIQAKLKLIKTEIDDAKLLMVQAQRIADMHNLNLLAFKISSEHDRLLQQLDKWKEIKEIDAPMSERIKLASFDNVFERLQGKRAIEPPKIEKERPILLLIMNKDGISHFTHPFVENWEFGDLFSSFMTAFNSFSSEIFSKSIDRVKIGENVILINPVDPFLVCYVIKGQSYPALQKLNKFTTGIKANEEIWKSLKNSIESCTVLGLNNPPSLGNLVNKIFT